MSPELRKTVQSFLSNYEEANKLPADGLMSYAQYVYYLKWAIELLQKCVVDDYKMTNGADWEYVRATIGFDKNGQPIIMDSWDDKVKRSLDNE